MNTAAKLEAIRVMALELTDEILDEYADTAKAAKASAIATWAEDCAHVETDGEADEW